MRPLGRAPVNKFVKFDGDEERRFADGQPAGPAYAKDQTNSFNERKEAVNQRAGGGPEDFRFGELADPFGKLSPKPPFRIEPQMMEQALVFLRQVVVRERPEDNRQRYEERPFQQLDGDDRIKRRRPFFDQVCVSAHEFSKWEVRRGK